MRITATFKLEPWQVEAIQSVSPKVELSVCARPEEDAVQVAEAEIIVAGRWSRDILLASRKLRWVHWMAAGVEHALLPELVESEVVLTNSRGVYAVPMAEHVFALLLALVRRLTVFFGQQARQEWSWQPGVDELAGKTLGVIGLGATGEEVAKRAKAFGMEVIATRRRPGLGGHQADRVLPPEGLPELLRRSDVIVICAPHTPETEALLGEAQFAQMRPGALLINIARGRLVDEPALVRALESGRLGGAGLDVFAREPLPPESPLWRMPNVIITPHVGGQSPKSARRATQVFCDNLGRYLAGLPLLNLVDKRAGY